MSSANSSLVISHHLNSYSPRTFTVQLKRGQGVGVLRAACPNTFSVEERLILY